MEKTEHRQEKIDFSQSIFTYKKNPKKTCARKYENNITRKNLIELKLATPEDNDIISL